MEVGPYKLQKFSVAIPLKVREVLNLREGDLVTFIIDDEHVELRKCKVEVVQ